MVGRILSLTNAELKECWNFIQENKIQNFQEPECHPLENIKGRFSFNRRDYVQLKVIKVLNDNQKSVTNNNSKVLAYHVAALHHPDINVRNKFIELFQKDGMISSNNLDPESKHEVSHLCNNKLCVNPEHFAPESSSINKSRNYCQVLIFINNQRRSCCKHKPSCLADLDKISNTFKYFCTNNPESSQKNK